MLHLCNVPIPCVDTNPMQYFSVWCQSSSSAPCIFTKFRTSLIGCVTYPSGILLSHSPFSSPSPLPFASSSSPSVPPPRPPFSFALPRSPLPAQPLHVLSALKPLYVLILGSKTFAGRETPAEEEEHGRRVAAAWFEKADEAMDGNIRVRRVERDTPALSM